MKHVVASLTIGACLLLSSAGVVFAANPHGGPAKGAGQLGTGGTGAASCGAYGTCRKQALSYWELACGLGIPVVPAP